MGHLTVKNYNLLYERMDRSIYGAYDSNEFYELLKILFTDEEALLCSFLPMLPSPIEKISNIWNINIDKTEDILKTLIKKGLVYKNEFNGASLYLLALPIFGFFEFSLMRTDGMYDREALSHLYNRYITEDLSFVKKFFARNPPLSRTFVQEDSLTEEITSEILPYEKISHIVDSAGKISVGNCFCRHKMAHAGKACNAPEDVCLSFGSIAETLIRNGIAREISKAEATKIIDDCISEGLVQIGDNIKKQTAVLCNCCGCCCELLLTYKKTGLSTIVTPSDYLARIDSELCSDCGTCRERCPVDAISSINNLLSVQKDWCLGCGVCARSCETGALKMESRPQKHDIPEDTLRKVVIAAIYQEKAGNYLFDDQKSIAHRIGRKLTNLILKLPLVKNILLNKHVQDSLLGFILKKSNLATLEL